MPTPIVSAVVFVALLTPAATAATAECSKHDPCSATVRVDRVAKWRSQALPANVYLTVNLYVRGKYLPCPEKFAMSMRCYGQGLAVRIRTRRELAPMRLRAVNVEARNARLRVVYWWRSP